MTSILVVDDYIVQQRVLRQVLSSAGYDVTVAGDGMEALEYLAEEPYDLVILDMAMPEMDGIEVLNRMRDHEPTRELPVIMLTANGEEEAKAVARAAGADAFLTKPASSHEIIVTVHDLIGEAK